MDEGVPSFIRRGKEIIHNDQKRVVKDFYWSQTLRPYSSDEDLMITFEGGEEVIFNPNTMRPVK